MKDIEIIFFMLKNKQGILVFFIVCTLGKKLPRGLASDKINAFV